MPRPAERFPGSEDLLAASDGLTFPAEDIPPVSSRSAAATDRLAVIPDDFLADSDDFVPVSEGNCLVPDDCVRVSAAG